MSTLYPFALVHGISALGTPHHDIHRYVPLMVGRGWSIVVFLLLVDLVTQCLLDVIFFEVIEVWIIVVPLFEDLYPLPCYWYCQPGSIEFSEMIRGIVICACYHVRPDSSFRELPHQAMLIVEVVIIHNHPVSFDLPRA